MPKFGIDAKQINILFFNELRSEPMTFSVFFLAFVVFKIIINSNENKKQYLDVNGKNRRIGTWNALSLFL